MLTIRLEGPTGVPYKDIQSRVWEDHTIPIF